MKKLVFGVIFAMMLLVGCSNDSDSGNGGTGGGTTCNVPLAPSGVSASAQSASSIRISWTSWWWNEDRVTSYRVYRSTSFWGTFSFIGGTGTSSGNYTDNGLSASTTYYYRISAVNSCGEGALSSSVGATTNCNLPLAPSNISIVKN